MEFSKEYTKDDIFLRYGDFLAFYHDDELFDTIENSKVKSFPVSKVPFITSYG